MSFNKKKNIKECFSFFITNIIVLLLSSNLFAVDDPKLNSSVEKQKLFFETMEPESTDQIISDHLIERFPIISDVELYKIVSSKSIEVIESTPVDSASEYSEVPSYRVTFEVPKNFLVDTAKILWALNIPNFESKIFQLYEGKEIYIDTWPNVVGTIKTKTYTGNFQAFRIRNWPFYKDPDPSKASLPPTKPGPGNPLGLFVVHYDLNSLRYFHGTNKNSLLNSKMRNLSHGCVRNDNGNIEKMKQFILKRVVKSTDLSGWHGSKKTLIYDLEEIDKFPVKITYKTFDLDSDDIGKYIVLYKDIYKYSNPGNIDLKWNNDSLITITNKENLLAEYNQKFGKDINEDVLNLLIEYVINNGKEYEKYYIEDLKEKFMVRN